MKIDLANDALDVLEQLIFDDHHGLDQDARQDHVSYTEIGGEVMPPN